MRIRPYLSSDVFVRSGMLVREGMAVRSAGDAVHPKPLLEVSLRPRDETIFWLTAAAEIEHFLMVHYLFAAYSVAPKRLAGAENAVQPIQDTLLQIAREEMGHLVTVQNLLTLLGAPLHFGREHSPFASEIYPFRFKLERASLDSLAKYAMAESPQDRAKLVAGLTPADLAIYDTEIRPRALASNGGEPVRHVGPMFGRLSALFSQELTARDLRLDRAARQARWSDWGFRPNPVDGIEADLTVLVHAIVATDFEEARAAAIAAIDEIADQGERADIDLGDGESHFERFFASYKALKAAEAEHGPDIVWPVADGPNTTAARSSPAPAGVDALVEASSAQGRIAAPRSRDWATLFNLRYRLLVGFLHHGLLLPGEMLVGEGDALGDRTTKGLLGYWTFKEMRRVKKIAAKLVQLPLGSVPGSNAGPPFELPYRLDLPPDEGDRWAGHADVLRAASDLTRTMLARPEDANDPFLAFLLEDDLAGAEIAERFAAGTPHPAGTAPTEFRKVANILDEAVRGFEVGDPHRAFWRDTTHAAFLAHSVKPVVPGDAQNSRLIGRIAVDEEQPSRMPRYRPRIDQSRIDYVREWINRGAPDSEPSGGIGVRGEPSPSDE